MDITKPDLSRALQPRPLSVIPTIFSASFLAEKSNKDTAIFIDAWKLPFFRKHLFAANVPHQICPGLIPSTIVLKINPKYGASVLHAVRAVDAEISAIMKARAKRRVPGVKRWG